MARSKKQLKKKEEEEEEAPAMEPADSDEDDASSGSDEDEDEGLSEEEYDSAAEQEDDQSANSDPEVSDDYYDSEEDEFEEQGSSDDEEDRLERQKGIADGGDADESDDEGVEILDEIEVDAPRSWPKMAKTKRCADGKGKTEAAAGTAAGAGGDDGKAENAEGIIKPTEATAKWMHTDDLSSDDEDDGGENNRIGRVPLHWYDDFDHIGYDAHGNQVIKASSTNKDMIDKVLDAEDQLDSKQNKFTVHDALNAKDVELTARQVELIRRLQSGAYAHPEHDANPDYIDYFSGVDPMKSGLNSDRYEKKSRFQPSKWEKLQVRRLLHRLKSGSINMDFLEGKVRDMNDLIKREEGEGSDKPFMLWKGDEEDELALRKGPQHMPAPKVPPPTHAYSYNPPEEYLPNEEELKEWEEMDPSDRPYGPHFIPKKFDNLRSVGAYEHSVKERFERCLDLYLCPRAMKRRLNIDPESLVPQLPKASDLRPFPTTKCIMYNVPNQTDSVVVRCLTVSPDGQFMASGDENGDVRLWEVQTGRLLRSWNLMEMVDSGEEKNEDGEGENETDNDAKARNNKPIASLEWNPNRSHHVILAAIGKCAVLISTGTGGPEDSEVTDALLSAASSCKNGGNIPPDSRAAKAVSWTSLKKQKFKSTSTTPVSAFGGKSGPIALLRTTRDVASVKWHRKGDYFVTVSPKAGAAAVLIHQLSKSSSQQPFGKAKDGEAQLACFHPQKPFLFVATKEHIKVYHLVKQVMVKRLLSGCRHISSLDVHVSGDHVVAGSLDRRLVWFDLDLSGTPYKTLKYHERAIRSVGFHPRYPLMASASDDGSVHVFHAMVYSDLMRNPLIVPVKVLRAHSIMEKSKLGALCMAFHPNQPWLFSAGADGNIHLFQDL
jgi:ribosome biogenesis protein ERB1